MLDAFLWNVLPLIFAHLLADFCFQSDQSVREKRQIPVLLRHGFTVGALSYVFVGALRGWQMPLGIALSHTLLDAWKLRTGKGTRLARFAIDQAGHLLILAFFSWAAAHSPVASAGIWQGILGEGYLGCLAFLSGAVFSVYVSSFLVELAIESLGFRADEQPAGGPAPGPKASLELGLPDGGRVIGYLERSLIFIFILAGYPAGIGFLVAAKSIFRFGELTEPNRRLQAEYIIIGTLLSILFGTVFSYLTAAALDLINA